ncbi:MAG: hypothetical protein ACNS62_22280 [Candidatus Cyclobacteriaceae bacterium M3_2C_046]
MKGTTIIEVSGHLDKKWESLFDDLKISYQGENTIISVMIRDESNLHGILNLVRDLNLKLISINPKKQ